MLLECGRVYTDKLTNGDRTHSWPSIAYITWNYKANIFLPNGIKLNIKSSQYCEGTLIDLHRILTAASCVPNFIRFDYANVSYEMKVTPNVYYPTRESMFVVYLGLSSKLSTESYAMPTVKMTLLEVRPVRPIFQY